MDDKNNNDESNFRKKFGRRLAAVRKVKGISQERFAYESGLARSHVSGIERGKINVSLSTIEAIATTLKIDPKELFDFDAADISGSSVQQEATDDSNGKNMPF